MANYPYRSWGLTSLAVVLLLAVFSASQGLVLAAPSQEIKACEEDLVGILRPADAFMGAIWVADGEGHVRRRIIHSHPRTNDAGPVLDAVEAAAAKLTKPTIFYLITHDNDVWDRWSRDSGTNEQKDRFSAVLLKCPSIFFLSWNPTVDENGRVGPRTIPIPDFEVFTSRHSDPQVPFSERNAGMVGWRGVTTGVGFAGTYASSDRFRMVNALTNIPGANVKFSGRVQDVPGSIVPDSMLGGSMGHDQMLKHKVIIDVDGNANAWEGLRWKLLAGHSLVKIRSSRRCIQWYYPLLKDKVHLRYLDLDKNDIAAEVKALAEDEAMATKLSKNSKAFAEEHLTADAARKYINEVIPNVWDLEPLYQTKDWRVDSEIDPRKISKKECTSEGHHLVFSENSGTFGSGGSSLRFPDGEHCSFSIKCPSPASSIHFRWKHNVGRAIHHAQLEVRQPQSDQVLLKAKGPDDIDVVLEAAEVVVQYSAPDLTDRKGFSASYTCATARGSTAGRAMANNAVLVPSTRMLGDNTPLLLVIVCLALFVCYRVQTTRSRGRRAV